MNKDVLLKDNNLGIEDCMLSLLESFESSGYLVGECVRKLIMHDRVDVYTVCINSCTDEILEVCKSKGLIAAEVEKGVYVKLYIGMYEVNIYSLDLKREGFLEILDTLEINFTVDSLIYSIEYGIIDWLGGYTDINKQTIRFVGTNPDDNINALNRIKIDYSVSLKALVLSIELMFSMRNSTGEICKNSFIENYTLIPPYKIRECLDRVLMTPNLDINGLEVIVRLLEDTLVPEFKECRVCGQDSIYHLYDVLKHMEMAVISSDPLLERYENKPIVRLALLFHDIAKPLVKTTVKGIDHFYKHSRYSGELTQDILRRFEYGEPFIELVSTLVSYHDTFMNGYRLSRLRKFIGHYGKFLMDCLIDVIISDACAHAPSEEKDLKINRLIDDVERIYNDDSAINIDSLLINEEYLIKKGVCGEEDRVTILNEILDCCLGNPALNNKYWLEKEVQKYVVKLRKENKQ